MKKMKPSYKSYKDIWRSIFLLDYQDKYTHEATNLSGGGGDYPTYDIHLKQAVTLPPRSFALASSLERFYIPDDVYLLTKNKSSIARMGVDASFNTLIDAGFRGYLTIELTNNSDKTVLFVKGQPILKVLVNMCDFQTVSYTGKYQDQENKPVAAR